VVERVPETSRYVFRLTAKSASVSAWWYWGTSEEALALA
jgi:hypothetical protein